MSIDSGDCVYVVQSSVADQQDSRLACSKMAESSLTPRKPSHLVFQHSLDLGELEEAVARADVCIVHLKLSIPLGSLGLS